MVRDRSELYVGLTVLAALSILLYSTFRIGSCAWVERPGARVVAHFDDAAGVQPRTEVLVAGVKVGEVERVDLDEGRARLTLRIDAAGVELPVDSTVSIRSRGLLGERVVEIARGEAERLVADGDTLTQTVEAPNLDAMMDDLAQVAEDIKEVSRSFRLVLGGASGEETIADIVGDIRVVARQARTFVEDNEAKLAQVVSNFDEVAANMNRFSADLSELVEDNEQTVGEMLGNFARASERMGDAVDDLALVSRRVEQGEGTLGRLLKDEGLYTDLEASVGELKRTLTEVRRAAEDAQEQLPVTVLGSLVGSLF